jgi:hypothetical protein
VASGSAWSSSFAAASGSAGAAASETVVAHAAGGELILVVELEQVAEVLRASLIHKRWRRILINPAFLRRYHEFHRSPPLLGV